jgi:hypothetical protein
MQKSTARRYHGRLILDESLHELLLMEVRLTPFSAVARAPEGRCCVSPEERTGVVQLPPLREKPVL